MMATKYLCLFIALFLLNCCTEEYNMNLPEQEPKIIIDAMITDGKPPYFVHLTLGKDAFGENFECLDNSDCYVDNRFVPVLNAQIIITDNVGISDTLLSDFLEQYEYTYNSETNKWDSTFVIDYARGQNGYYRTTKLQGVSGNTYNISVLWKGDEYTSTCTMPICPKIDSVTYEFTVGRVGKSDYYVPHIWFKDNPNTKDYYLFKTYGGAGVWSRSILSDEFINNNVTGLNVFQGESPDWWRNGYPMQGGEYKIEMYAITKEIYEYYEALIAQFRSDGGVYTPTPASPPTNISGNSQGFFSASGLQVVTDSIPYIEEK